MASGVKSDRLDLRLTQRQKAEVERAAASTGRSVNDFFVSVLVKEAAVVIAHERELVTSEEAWQALSEIVERPARSVDGFARLLRRASVFTE